VGADVLREDEAAKVSDVIQVATALYATAAGREAFQHSSPDKGISIFGRALLDGLKGTPEIKLDPRQQRFARRYFRIVSKLGIISVSHTTGNTYRRLASRKNSNLAWLIILYKCETAFAVRVH
jgi:hypothetical protein